MKSKIQNCTGSRGGRGIRRRGRARPARPGQAEAYTVTETEVLDAAAQKEYTPLIQAAQKTGGAGARNFRTAGGRVVALEGTAPKRVGITEWDSLDQAQAFYNSKAFKDLAPQRDKAVKVQRRYVVEALN